MAQKAISLKLDSDLLEKLDIFCYEKGEKRNRVINNAINEYLKKV